MNSKKLKVIADFGRKYQNTYLYREKKKEELQKLLEKEWWEALKFFFGRSFMRGRRDKISVLELIGKLKNNNYLIPGLVKF